VAGVRTVRVGVAGLDTGGLSRLGLKVAKNADVSAPSARAVAKRRIAC
jgi:hypothetical protein